MKRSCNWVRQAMFLVLAGCVAASLEATTLIRESLDRLVATHPTIVVGEVVEAHSYWNAEGTFILTDFRIRSTEVLKGDSREKDLTVTLMGGSVGDLTAVIPGGADYRIGRKYVLFLGFSDLPGAPNVRTAPGHSQGVFEVVKARDGERAISQASLHPLHPDALGFVDPPGGADGLLLNELIRSIQDLAKSQAKQEVKK